MLNFKGGKPFDFKAYRLDEIGFAYGHLMVSRDAGNAFWGHATKKRYGHFMYEGVAKYLAGYYNMKGRPFLKWLDNANRYPQHHGEDLNTGDLNDFGSRRLP
jgi:hypothetical protein